MREPCSDDAAAAADDDVHAAAAVAFFVPYIDAGATCSTAVITIKQNDKPLGIKSTAAASKLLALLRNADDTAM